MKIRQERRSGAKPDNRAKDRHGRSQRVRPARVEPSTFAWVEPLDELEPIVVEKLVEKEVVVEKPVVFEKEVLVEKIVERIVEKPVIYEQPAGSGGAAARVKSPKRGDRPHTVIIGRGPSLAERLALTAPNPKPVLAGACALLIALGGVALISPSGEQATAARSQAVRAAADQAERTPGLATAESSPGAALSGSDTRDPFAAKGYKPQTNGKDGKKQTGNKGSAKQNSKKKAKFVAPATASPSPFTAEFVTYSSYTPWANSRHRSGSWIEFGGKPTVKVVAVGAHSVELFVVTDVEVLTEKSRNIAYSYPLRTVKMGAKSVVRFADYRDIQGDDVQYTIRFRGSVPSALSTKRN